MADEIRLVRGDTRTHINVKLTDEATGDPIDLSANNTVVTVLFRAVTAETVLATLATEKVTSGNDHAGRFRFNFPGNTLDVPAGYYEGEIKVMFGSEQMRVFTPLKFFVREPF